MTIFIKIAYGIFHRAAWTGGDVPPPCWERTSHIGAQLYSFFLSESIAECGGLDLWECAGTSSEERLAIFQNQAKLDAWATFNHPTNKGY